MEDLKAIYASNTIAQSNRLLSGKWVKISGTVSQNYGSGSVFLESSRGPLITLLFSAHWFDQLVDLDLGSTITIRGTIKRVGDSEIAFHDCELV